MYVAITHVYKDTGVAECMAVKVTMVAAASSLLLLLLVAPPLSSAAIRRPSPNSGKFAAQGVRSILKQSYKSFRDYLKDRAQQSGDTDLPGRGNNQDEHQLGSSAADSYGAFTFDLSLGTLPPQTLSVVMDITSELVWTQCGEPCQSCPVLTTPSFQPGNSGSFAPIGCDDPYCQSLLPGDHRCAQTGDYCGFTESFLGGGDTSGYLANETFSFGTTAIPSMPFGCSDNITVPDLAGASGFVGFSRGPLSLVSQLGITSFSYLIASPDDAGNVAGSLSWSWDASAAAPPAKGSTPLLSPKTKQNPYWYYVKLTGVEVDGQLLTAIPAGTFDAGADGSGGVFLSTTLPVTYLDQAAYKVLRTELVSRFQSQAVIPVDPAGDLDHLCFLTQYFANAKVPKLALVFDGAGAAMELTGGNYFFEYDEQTCLTILPSIGVSVLGSLLQVGRTMTYELHADGGGRLTFETAAAAGAPTVPLVIIIATLLAAWPKILF